MSQEPRIGEGTKELVREIAEKQYVDDNITEAMKDISFLLRVIDLLTTKTVDEIFIQR